ncbi:MAG: SDR family oxidoreductase [Verrucomicrobiota bacterium]
MSQTICITGANRGIGLDLVKAFLKHGHRVIAGARDLENAAGLHTLRDEFSDFLIPCRMNLNDHDSVQTTFSELAEAVSGIDLLINNAAILPEEGNESFMDLDLKWFGQAFDTNVMGTAAVTRSALPLLKKANHPCIVNISSEAGLITPKSGYSYYCYGPSKAALNMLTRTLAEELRPEGISVVAISPGWVQTEMGGPHAQITTEESAQALYETTIGLSLEESGKFMRRDGSSIGIEW